MDVLFIVLNETEFLDDILDEFVKIGIKGATILDSQGMGRALTARGDEPFFGALRNLLDNSRPYNKTIFTVVEDKDLLDKAIESVKNVVGDIHRPGVGMMFTLPVGNIYGMSK